MCLRSLLVVGRTPNARLRRALARHGFASVAAHDMPAGLREVREGNVSAVLVAGERPGVDALEFVLNVRDIDGKVPILIAVGTVDADVDEALMTVGGALPLREYEGPESLAAEVELVLGAENA